MPSGPPKVDPDLVEIRRGILQAAGAADFTRLSSYFPPNTFDLEIGRAILPKQMFQAVVESLRSAGLIVETIEDEITKLPRYIYSEPPATSFHLYKKPSLRLSGKKVEWRLFSYTNRNFYPCPCFHDQGAEKLFVREHAIVGAFDERYSLQGLWVASTEEDGLLPALRTETLIRAHMQSLPMPFYFLKEGSFATIFRNYIWLPGVYYQLLFGKIAVHQPEKGEDRWFIRLEDLEALRRIIESIGLFLQEGEPPQAAKAKSLEAAESAAELIKLCYTHYLRSKEEKFGEFAEIAAKRDWDAISDKKLKSKITELSNAAYKWQDPAAGLVEYICGLLPTDIHWSEWRAHGLSTDIEGVAIDADTSGFHAEMPFYKVVLPEFELTLGLLTSRLSEPAGRIRMPIYWIADKWRIVPYAGRLIFSSGRYTKVLLEDRARKEAGEQAYDRIQGIPTLEDVLVRELYLSAFFLDIDERLWKGCPEFSRYFTGYGRLLKKETGEFEQPTALMEDMLGNKFYLAYGEANYIRRAENIEWMGRDGPKRFFARSSLIQQLRMGLPIPYFSLIEGTSPRDVGWDGVLSGTYLALLRYYQKRTEEELYDSVKTIRQPEERKRQMLAQIISKGRALKHKGSIYYVYEFMKPEQLKAILEKMAVSESIQFSYNTLSRFHSIIHPFRSGRSILAGANQWEPLLRKNFPAAARHPIVINSDDAKYWTDKILEGLKQWGVVIISTHPWRRRIAAAAIGLVREAMSGFSLEIAREDIERDYRGRKIIETHYRLSAQDYLIARKLQKNPSIRVSFY
jgi:hypothetical protein